MRGHDHSEMMQHVRHRHLRGIRVAEHDHSHRIANQNHRNAGFIEQFRRRIIIRRERGDLLTALFHGANGFDGDFHL